MPARDSAIRTVVGERSYLECPRWHEGRIWFSDFYTHEVLSADEDGGDLRVEAVVEQQPAGLGWLPDGRLLIVSMRDGRVLRREPDGTLVTHAERGTLTKGHLNDMLVDDRGRAYVGSFGFDLMGGAPPETTGLLRMDPDGSARVVAEELAFPNGMALSDQGVLLVDETFANRVTAFDVAADGSLGNRRVWARFGEPPVGSTLEEVLPQGKVAADGCCLDAEGALWVADALNQRAIRVREGGEIVDEVHAGTGVFACMLGGSDGRTLYLCAAPDFLEHKRKDTREAALLAVRADVPRAGRP